MAHEKKIVIIAGPNGAGKTTFACEFLPREAGCPDFINVDLIAAGLSPFAPEKAALRAAKLMVEEIRRRFESGRRHFSEVYRPLVSSWVLYDNSVTPHKLLAEGENP